MKKLISVLLITSLLGITFFTTSTGMNEIKANADDVAVSVYTGELVPASTASVRPIAVMMPTDKVAQPSYGISYAKVLYEVMEEGSISRQMAIIDEWQGLEKIGNIRSCREYYIHLATEWDPILIHCGGVIYMKSRITKDDINNLSGTAEYGAGGSAPGASAFFRSSDRKAPHNMYISASGITAQAQKLGYSINVRPEYYNASHFAFAAAGMPNTLDQYPTVQVANTINLSNIFPYTKSSLTYNPATGCYDKSIHGAAQKDGLNGVQLSFSNVVIQTCNWATKDKKGYLSFDIVGSGEGYFCTMGKAIHVTWVKTGDYAPTKYYDDNGNEVVFNTGKTYIAIAQSGKAPIFG